MLRTVAPGGVDGNAASLCLEVRLAVRSLYEKAESLLDLYKNAEAKPRGCPDSAKGSESAQIMLQNLATAVQSLRELRNELGLGHGKTKPSPAVARRARLAFNASRAVVEFVLETWHVRRDQEAREPAAPTTTKIVSPLQAQARADTSDWPRALFLAEAHALHRV